MKYLGANTIKRIYKYADVFHCDPIEKVADEFINLVNIPTDSFDNVAKCRYEVPDYWTIGQLLRPSAKALEVGACNCPVV